MKRKLSKGKKATMSMPITVKSIDKENHTLTMVASTQTEDRHGDVVVQAGWDLSSFKKNPVILNSHRYDDATEVIAKATRTEIVGKGKRSRLEQDWKFAVAENPKAKILFDLYAGGFLSASSVGFIPKKFAEDKDGNRDWSTIEEAELLEVSAISVPANARALAKAKGIDIEMLKSEHEKDNNEPDDEVSEDPQVPSDEGADAPGNSDGDETGQGEDADTDEGGDEAQPGDETMDTDPEGDDGEPTEEKAEEGQEKGIKNLDEALGDEDDEENGDDSMIEATGKTHSQKVAEVVRKMDNYETRKLKRVLGIVNDMLGADQNGARMEKKVREQVRKRKVNQAIRALYSLK